MKLTLSICESRSLKLLETRSAKGFRMTHPMAVLLVSCILITNARADNFKSVHYDQRRDQLVVQMDYRGTHPDHTFHLNWGRCRPVEQEPGMWQVAVDVLDDQWNDAATTDYSRTLTLDLSKLRCRPAHVTLRTAPRFYYTLTIPAGTGSADRKQVVHAPAPPICAEGFVHRGGSMCVPVGESQRVQSGALMSKPEALIVRPGLEIAIFGNCGFHSQSETMRSGDSTAVPKRTCAEP
jgi:hypothetical protein